MTSLAKTHRDLRKIGNALKLALDHLEYCNYGDNWEKECAVAQKLPDKIKKALAIAGRYGVKISS